MGLEDIVNQILSGLSTVGDGFSNLILYILAAFGITVQPIYVKVASMILLVYVLWKYAKHLPKLLVIVIFLLALSQATAIFLSTTHG